MKRVKLEDGVKHVKLDDGAHTRKIRVRTAEHNRHRNTLRAAKRTLLSSQRKRGYVNDISHPQRVRAKFLLKVLSRAQTRTTNTKMQILRHAKPAWTGLVAPQKNLKDNNWLPTYEDRAYTLKELVARGFHVVPWDGRYGTICMWLHFCLLMSCREALVFVDPDDIIMAVGTPKTDDNEQEFKFEDLTDFIRTQRQHMEISEADIARNRRGEYPAAAAGVSFGGGQPVRFYCDSLCTKIDVF